MDYTKKTLLISFSLFAIILLSNKIINCAFAQESDLESNKYYIDEICSYNYESYRTDNETSQVNCTCTKGFTTYRNLIFGKYTIKCDYEQKRRFIVFFFSIFLLFGFEYLYLERYYYFALILSYILFVLISSCYFSIVSRDKSDKEDKPRKTNIIFRILPYTILIWWVLNNFLIITGNITDGNGQETYDDISYMVFNYSN